MKKLKILVFLAMILLILIMPKEIKALSVNDFPPPQENKKMMGDLYGEVESYLTDYEKQWNQAHKPGSVFISVQDFVTNTSIFCAEHNGYLSYKVPIDVNAKKIEYEKKRQEWIDYKNAGQPSGMPSSAWNQAVRAKEKAYYIAYAQYWTYFMQSAALIYDQKKTVEVDTSTETDETKIAQAYAFGTSLKSGKYAYSSIEEYRGDTGKFKDGNDEASKTYWDILGQGSETTDSKIAKQYAKDVVNLRNASSTSSTGTGKKNGTYIEAKWKSTIDFKTGMKEGYIYNVSIDGGELTSPTSSFDSIAKDTDVSIQIPYQEGKTEYTVKIKGKYKTYKARWYSYTSVTYQNLDEGNGSEDGEDDFEIIIIITTAPPTEIKVTKDWVVDGTGSLPSGLTVDIELLEDGTVKETKKITGNGSCTFKNLDPNKTYTVREKAGATTKTIGGKEYTFTYDTSEKSGTDITITNKVKPPLDELTPTPEEPGEGDVEIKKTVEYVLSKYEGDTSKNGVGGAPGDVQDEKNATVQRGDEVVFKIEVKAKKDKKVEEPRDATEDEKKEAGYITEKDYTETGTDGGTTEECQTVKVFCGFYCKYGGICQGHDEKINHTKITHYGEKIEYKDLKVTETHKYRAESFKVTDELLAGDDVKLKIKGIFSSSNSNYASKAGVSIPDSKGWTQSGNEYIWKADASEIENWQTDKGKSDDSIETTATFYIICDVKEEWKEYGDSETNKATLTEVKFAEKIEKEIKGKKVTHKATKTTYSCTKHTSDKDWKDTSTSEEDVNKDLEPEKGDGETINPNKSDEAKVTLQGYEANIEKKLERVNAQIHKANDTGDGEGTKVEWGDLLDYKITVTNKGETNFYEGLYVNDYFKESELKYVGTPDGDNYYNGAYETGLTKKKWNDGPISSWATSDSGDGKNYYKDDEEFGLGKGIEDGKEGLYNGKDKSENITTVVVSKPGESVTNNADLLAIKNRNGVEIEMDVEPAKVTNEVRTYKAGVDKFVSEVTSEGLKCSDTKTNEVASKYPIDNREGQEDSQKQGNPAMSDRGDKIKFTIKFKNKSDEASIWKFKLTDEFDPQLEYLDEFNCDSTDDGDCTVTKEGDNKLTIIYVGKDLEPGEELSNNKEWAEVTKDQEVTIDLYFQVVDGAEYAKKGETYKNTVTIDQVWNRNSKKLVEGNIELDKKESSDWVKVRQISASIDKYVSSLFGGIEGDVSSTINNATRNRKDEFKYAYDSQEYLKRTNPVEVERGDEITYTVVVKNTQPFDNSGGLISAMNMVDTYDEHLIFSRIASGPVTLENHDIANRKLDIKYTGGHLLPEESFEFTLVFIMTEEKSDISSLYEQTYENKIQIKELKNVNDWTWSLEGATNPHHNDTCSYAGPCVLSSLQNEGGITADLPSSDYVYMLAYAVELEKYIVNVQHTNDDGSVENYNKDNQWASQDNQNNRETMNYIDGYGKTTYKETYPVQVEKGDIVTYEIKIKNTYNNHNGGLVNWTTLQPSIYKIDISDVFNSEDDTEIDTSKKNIGLSFKEAKATKGGEVKVNYINDSAYMFEFTPQGQCPNAGKNTYNYGIGAGEEATFTIAVEVTRSNMYLYELINRATIQDVYNRNNNVGTYGYSSPEGRTGVEYKVTNGNRLYKYPDDSIVNPIKVKDPLGIEYDTSLYITDADYINLKDLIISGYVWDDTDENNEEDGLMTWGLGGSTDNQVEGDVYAYLYRLEPLSQRNYPNQATLVMKTKVQDNGYYIFGTNDTEVYGDRVTVNQMHRYEPITYKKPQIKVNGTVTKDTENKEIYLGGFTNYRIVKAPNKDYNPNGSTTRYWRDNKQYKGYYQYYVEFEYNGMKYTHTVYGTDSDLIGDIGTPGNKANTTDGKYNLYNGSKVRATKEKEEWLPWKKLVLKRIVPEENNSEYYEIDSNSAEFKSVREAFNNKFETIAWDRGIASNGTETPLSYTHPDPSHISTLNYTKELYIRARSFVTNWADISVHADTRSENAGDTERLFFWDSENDTGRKPGDYGNTVGTTEETEYLKYINLGLIQRPSLDLELTKDVHDVQVDINEKTTVYDYSSETIDRGNLSLINRVGVNDDRTVQLENLGGEYTPEQVASDNNQNHIYYYNTLAGYQKTGYQLDLYKSDWLYRYDMYVNDAVKSAKYNITVANSQHNNDEEASHSELNVQITYKYTITNKSNTKENNRNEVIIGALNELVDYHQADLIPNTVGTYVINRGDSYRGKQTSEEVNAESGYVLVGETPRYSNINGNNNTAYGVGDLGDFKTCYIYGISQGDVISEDDYTKQIGAAGHTKGFELEDERLYPGDSVDIYLTFTVSRNALENRTLNLENVTKYNVAEINAFSSYYSKNKEYETEWNKDLDTPGLVDKDSNPGNTEITKLDDVDNYEDDTFKVDIKFTLEHNEGNGNNRIIDGLVWEDVNYGDKGTAIGHTVLETGQVTGDGLYYEYRNHEPDHDCLVGGVKVELIELITVGDTVFEERIETETSLETKSSSDSESKGRYKLSGFIPGNYIVRFTYGNKDSKYVRFSYDEAKQPNDENFKYNGQDYKSTRYQSGIEDNNQNNDGYVANVWHDMISDDVNELNNGIHISDARDDEVRRLEVIAYSRTINNKVAEILNTRDLTDPTFTDNTLMYADTAKLQIEVEHLKYVENPNIPDNSEDVFDKPEYKTVDIYHGRVPNDIKKFIVGNYYKVDAFGKKISRKADENNRNIEEGDNNNQHKITYYYPDGNDEKNGGLSKPLARYTYRVPYIDFGMEARPTTNMSLHKMISGIKVTTADGETIVEVEYEPTYDKDAAVPTKILTGAEHIQHVANLYKYTKTIEDELKAGFTNEQLENIEITPVHADIMQYIYNRQIRNKQGFYYINIDEDLMQGAVVTINYSIIVRNDSEVDTLEALTGFKYGEEIYDETFDILTGESEYNYIETKHTSNENLPTYENGKLSVASDDKNKGLNYGYYLGATYYNGDYHPRTHVVETRIDQIIDYVDNDLTVREQDNNTKDATWRNVSLAELVAGEIQKDVVGQEWDNNTYYKDIQIKYVPYGREDNKVISVNNVDNMLSDSVYRIKNLNDSTSSKKSDGTYYDSTTDAIYHANVQGNVKASDTYKNTGIYDDATNLEVTIMDEEAREYVTSAKNNIVLSVPDENANPDLYKYLIPEKALNGTGIDESFFNSVNESIFNLDKYSEYSAETKDAAKKLWNLFNTYRRARVGNGEKNTNTYKWFINFTNIIISDDSIKEIYDDEYKSLGRELLIQIVKDEDNKYLKFDEAKGTFNGDKLDTNNPIYKRSNTQSSARINLQTTRTLSADKESKDVSFENIAEIIQFSNQSGRRDEYAIVGDSAIWKGAWKAATPTAEGENNVSDPCGGESNPPIPTGVNNYNSDINNPTRETKETYDTDTTEVILLSPPTGVSQSQLVKIEQQETIASVAVIAGGIVMILSLGGIVLIRKRAKNKFYR